VERLVGGWREKVERLELPVLHLGRCWLDHAELVGAERQKPGP
jgi:hypothetical protein